MYPLEAGVDQARGTIRSVRARPGLATLSSLAAVVQSEQHLWVRAVACPWESPHRCLLVRSRLGVSGDLLGRHVGPEPSMRDLVRDDPERSSGGRLLRRAITQGRSHGSREVTTVFEHEGGSGAVAPVVLRSDGSPRRALAFAGLTLFDRVSLVSGSGEVRDIARSFPAYFDSLLAGPNGELYPVTQLGAVYRLKPTNGESHGCRWRGSWGPSSRRLCW